MQMGSSMNLLEILAVLGCGLCMESLSLNFVLSTRLPALIAPLLRHLGSCLLFFGLHESMQAGPQRLSSVQRRAS
jgi:hypothetical protein